MKGTKYLISKINIFGVCSPTFLKIFYSIASKSTHHITIKDSRNTERINGILHV